MKPYPYQIHFDYIVNLIWLEEASSVFFKDQKQWFIHQSLIVVKGKGLKFLMLLFFSLYFRSEYQHMKMVLACFGSLQLTVMTSALVFILNGQQPPVTQSVSTSVSLVTRRNRRSQTQEVSCINYIDFLKNSCLFMYL